MIAVDHLTNCVRSVGVDDVKMGNLGAQSGAQSAKLIAARNRVNARLIAGRRPE